MSATLWVALGFTGQALFAGRLLLQIVFSERAKRSMVPEGFWWLSLAGGVVLLCYALHRRDPVFGVGQLGGIGIYARNLVLLRRERGSELAAQPLA